MYRKQARKNYLALAKAKKRSTKKIRATIRKQLAYIKRDIGYLERYMEDSYAPTSKEISLLMTIYKLYEQQQYMYQNKVHSVENRIVSISQSGTIQGTNWSLPGTPTGRPDISNQRQQKFL